jgi:hypothetical protein
MTDMEPHPSNRDSTPISRTQALEVSAASEVQQVVPVSPEVSGDSMTSVKYLELEEEDALLKAISSSSCSVVGLAAMVRERLPICGGLTLKRVSESPSSKLARVPRKQSMFNRSPIAVLVLDLV